MKKPPLQKVVSVLRALGPIAKPAGRTLGWHATTDGWIVRTSYDPEGWTEVRWVGANLRDMESAAESALAQSGLVVRRYRGVLIATWPA